MAHLAAGFAADVRSPTVAYDLVADQILAATVPDEITGEIDYQRLANLGLTSPVLARQLRSILQMAQHLAHGKVTPEGVAPSLIAVGEIIASQLEPAARIEAGRL